MNLCSDWPSRFYWQSLILTAFLAVPALAEDRAVVNAPSPTMGWSHSSPESQGVSSRKLARAIEFLREHKIPVHDIVIVRHGYLLLDAPFFPYRNEEPHDLASVTKSITTTLVGIAIDKGVFRSIQTPIVQIFPEAYDRTDPRKQRMTLASLLEMRSGLSCITNREQGEKTLIDTLGSSDWVAYTLGLPMADDPETHFVYCSSAMHVLSGALSRATGQSALNFGNTYLFEPLGIQHPQWGADAQGRNTGWGGLQLRPADMAKLGYLFLRHGSWDGRQVVSRAWTDTATQPHPADAIYGYGWWVGGDVVPFAYSAGGRGSQAIAVDPARDLVVVIAAAISDPQQAAELKKRVLDAIESDAALPPDPLGQAQLAAALENAAQPPRPQPIRAFPVAVARLSGKRLSLSSNPFGVTSLTLGFDHPDEASAEITYSGVVGSLILDPLKRSTTTGPRQVGLDGVPRLSRAAGHGFLVALDGAWVGSTFVLHYDTVAGINKLTFTISPTTTGAEITIEEPSLNMKSEVHGVFARQK